MYTQRLAHVFEKLQQMGLKQMMITDPKSIFYLTGIVNEPLERLYALYICEGKTPVLFVNRLFNIPENDFENVWHTDTDKPLEQIAARIDKTAPLGIDKEWRAAFLIPLMEMVPGLKVCLASDAVDACRACKDEAEKQLMRAASVINDEVIEKAAAFIRVGMTEKEIAAFIENEYAKAGCSSVSFPTIVSFGAHAADPHHDPDDTVLEEGNCVLIDMGCCKDHYCSDMTRTYFCGQPDADFIAVHDLVRRANEAAEAIIKPGVRLCDIDAAARNLITEAGYGAEFNHRLGHFIGQTDHEKGDVSSANENNVQPGMVFSIEPGVYLKGRFGVRIEDLVLVTEDGCEILNRVDKHWKTVG
ncbi:MAG: Xaa-Pro peptidase family protein [Clostridia bacterium]|nr:Xaa-Pro peptidase family protein [Clostridia bacterium]